MTIDSTHDPDPSIDLGGVVLCGGESRRMGRSKALLPFGEELLIQRVVRKLASLCKVVAVVAAEGQKLPRLHENAKLVIDQRPAHGPLEGIRQGLRSLEQECSQAFVMGCDAPFMRNEIIIDLLARKSNHAICIPEDDRHLYPLAAIYDTSCSATAETILANGKRRPIALLDECTHVRVRLSELQSVDPNLDSFVNINDPESYERAIGRFSSDEDPTSSSPFH